MYLIIFGLVVTRVSSQLMDPDILTPLLPPKEKPGLEDEDGPTTHPRFELILCQAPEDASRRNMSNLSAFEAEYCKCSGPHDSAVLGIQRTVRPIGEPATYVNDNGVSCRCVPYYSCNLKSPSLLVTVEIDIRPDDPCNDALEICCVNPKDVTRPKPDSSKLKGCGYKNPEGIGLTFKNAPTQFGEYPWVVALLDAKNNSFAGAGVLIHPEVVMTGAHIAHKFAPGELKIRAGEWNTQTVKELYEHQERTVKDIYIHQDFNRKNLRNDIALLRLERPVGLAKHINIICMPEQDEVFDSHKNCVANGWGKDKFGHEGHYAVFLKKVEIDMVEHSHCDKLLKRTRLGARFSLHDSFVCAGGQEGKDTCLGDGGAPLACPIGDNRHKLTGLVAWGIGCGQKDLPAVYTNVPKYRNWADSKMKDWGLDTTSYKI